MAKFRKKPIVIEAEQWFPGMQIAGVEIAGPARYGTDLPEGAPFIDTLEGKHRVTPGDWIITGVNGEKYPCKDEIFKKTYEPA